VYKRLQKTVLAAHVDVVTALFTRTDVYIIYHVMFGMCTSSLHYLGNQISIRKREENRQKLVRCGYVRIDLLN
jgi:hypothetical protein